MVEPKPCPFCGSTSELETKYSLESSTGARVVKCWGCGAIGPYGASNSNMAIDEWNRRTDVPVVEETK